MAKNLEPADEHLYAGPEVKDFVLGINDGLVSIVALVSGVAGAVSNTQFVLIAGLAGTLAGAISMASGAYISTKSQKEVFESEINREKQHLRDYPQHETEEVRAFYIAKWFKGKELDLVVRRITSNSDVWLDVMLKEEFGISKPVFPHPLKSAATMGLAFILGAVFPISPYLFSLPISTAFPLSVVLTALCLFMVGALKARIFKLNPVFSGLEMLAIGTVASLVTYYAGTLFGLNGT